MTLQSADSVGELAGTAATMPLLPGEQLEKRLFTPSDCATPSLLASEIKLSAMGG